MKRQSTTATFDPDTPITQTDMDSRALTLCKRVAGRAVLPKKCVRLYLDAALADQFKRMAGQREYQSIINETPKSSLHQSNPDGMLRRLSHEELNTRKAA